MMKRVFGGIGGFLVRVDQGNALGGIDTADNAAEKDKSKTQPRPLQ
jgi:hypothetical protein